MHDPQRDAPALANVVVGRQPILDTDLRTVGYELLFRRCASSTIAEIVDGDAATAQVVLDALTEIGFHNLVGSHTAFINLTHEFCERPDLLAVLPTERVVLEVLEDVEPSPAVLDGIDRLRALGFRIALDDFVYRPERQPLLDRAHIVKYDLLQQTWRELRSRARADHAAGRLVVVERIETEADHRSAGAAGADLFQGFFFARPSSLSAPTIPPGRLVLLELLARVSDPDATLEQIASTIAQDVSMSLKTLRSVNAAATGVRVRIRSIEHAAALLGRDNLRNLASLTAMVAIDEAPSELVVLALARARTCELLARRSDHPSPATCYTAGMLSLLDVMTGTDMAALVSRLSLGDEIADALLGRDGAATRLLDRARRAERAAGGRGHDAAALAAYQAAMTWATALVTASDATA